MKTTGRVQDCGCISLAPEVQEQTGLRPGATFSVEITPDKRVVLTPIKSAAPVQSKPGSNCG